MLSFLDLLSWLLAEAAGLAEQSAASAGLPAQPVVESAGLPELLAGWLELLAQLLVAYLWLLVAEFVYQTERFRAWVVGQLGRMTRPGLGTIAGKFART
jgi:hypothetical protein